MRVCWQVVIEGQRNGGASAAVRCRPAWFVLYEFVECDEVNDLAQCLQLEPEHVQRHGRDNLAARSQRWADAVIHEHEAVPADARERAHGAVDPRRAEERCDNAARHADHR